MHGNTASRRALPHTLVGSMCVARAASGLRTGSAPKECRGVCTPMGDEVSAPIGDAIGYAPGPGDSRPTNTLLKLL